MKNLILLSIFVLAFSSCKKEEIQLPEVPATASDLVGSWDRYAAGCNGDVQENTNIGHLIVFTSTEVKNLFQGDEFPQGFIPYEIDINGTISTGINGESFTFRTNTEDLVMVQNASSCANGEFKNLYREM